MRKISVLLTMMICTLGAARTYGQAHQEKSMQREMQPMATATRAAKDDCSAKAMREKRQKKSKPQASRRMQDNSMDPQSLIEYGGGG